MSQLKEHKAILVPRRPVPEYWSDYHITCSCGWGALAWSYVDQVGEFRKHKEK